MRKRQTQLLLLCYAPTALVVLPCLALLYRRPDFIDLLFALIATILMFACSIALKQMLWAHLMDPLRSLAENISSMEPGRPIPHRPPLLEQLVIALEQRMSQLASEQHDKTGMLERENLRFAELVKELQQGIDALARAKDLDRTRRNLADRMRSVIASATTARLHHIIAHVNLLAAEGTIDNSRAEQITIEASSLVLLARELQAYDYSSEAEVPFDLRQLGDEVIACMAPILPQPVQRVTPFYDGYGQKRFIGKAAMIKALVFNYLLANLRQASSPRIDLHVNCVSDGQLVFGLSSSGTQGTEDNDRLARLLSACGAAIHDGILSVPVAPDESFTQPDTGLRAMIVSHDLHEEASLATRLQSMRVNVVRQDYDVDVCIATIDDDAEIIALREKLHRDSRLLLLGNTTLFNLPNTRHLGDPLRHEALASELLELSDTRVKEAPLILVVDDNPSNLKLTVLQLQELGATVESADSGAAAVALANRHDFSLVIVDAHLRDANGIDVAAAISASRADVRVVMLTARLTEDERGRLREASIEDILIKPATRPELLQLLTRHKLIAPTPDIAPLPPLTASRTTFLAIFDRDLSVKLANNRPELADEILEELIGSLDSDCRDINVRFEAGKLEEFRETIHRLHGAVQYCGVPRLKNALAKLEALSRTSEEQEIRLALNLFNGEVDALLDWYDPHKNYFGTSILRGGDGD